MAIKRPYQMKTISSNLFVIDRKSYQRKKDKDKKAEGYQGKKGKLSAFSNLRSFSLLKTSFQVSFPDHNRYRFSRSGRYTFCFSDAQYR